MAGEVLGELGGVGRSVMDSLARNNRADMLGAGAVGGLLGALLGRGGRDLAGTALTLGGTAVAGTLAWNFYKKWAARNAAPGAPAPAGWNAGSVSPSKSAPAPGADSSGQGAGEDSAALLLEAMVFAARADGHIDETERARIDQAVRQMFPDQDLAALLDPLMTRPIDPRALAGRVRSPEQARDLYRLSCAIVDTNQFMARSYLNGLADALGLGSEERARMEAEAAAAGNGARTV
ncbi:MAG: tellurite resistance TerB family protein [Desulfovibrionaceae bacterium]|nr:tellurite resistance TerB family protein [Desulfovibrionaceae bacterium]